MRSAHAPKAFITDEVCITHKVRIDAKFASEQELVIQQSKNEANIAKAEAEAQAAKIAAEAEAEALKILAEAQAEANRVLAESLTDEILKQLYYEKWDGKLPTVMPFGHGRKSAYILMGFFPEIGEEVYSAVDGHMADAAVNAQFMVQLGANPLAMNLHIADALATYLDEHNQ